MKKLIVTVKQEFNVPNNFEVKMLNDKSPALKVGDKFGRPSFNWSDWQDVCGEEGHLTIGKEDDELTVKMYMDYSTTFEEWKFEFSK